MVTKIALKLALANTSLEWLLSHVVTLNGEVSHYVMKDGATTACGEVVFGAKTLPIERMGGRLCGRCTMVVKSLMRE